MKFCEINDVISCYAPWIPLKSPDSIHARFSHDKFLMNIWHQLCIAFENVVLELGSDLRHSSKQCLFHFELLFEYFEHCIPSFKLGNCTLYFEVFTQSIIIIINISNILINTTISSLKVRNSLCRLYHWFNGVSCVVKGYPFPTETESRCENVNNWTPSLPQKNTYVRRTIKF